MFQEDGEMHEVGFGRDSEDRVADCDLVSTYENNELYHVFFIKNIFYNSIKFLTFSL